MTSWIDELTSDHLEEVLQAVETQGASHERGRQGKTLMHAMAKLPLEGRRKLRDKLIEAGADVHAQDDDGKTPLHAAIEARNGVEEIRRLIEAGANVHAQDLEGHTPLHAAAMKELLPVVQLLVKHGANLLATNHQGQKASDLAQSLSPHFHEYLCLMEETEGFEEPSSPRIREVF